MFDVRIGLATATVGDDAGQLLNMVFGNTSLHEDVMLVDVIRRRLAAFGPDRTMASKALRRRAERSAAR